MGCGCGEIVKGAIGLSKAAIGIDKAADEVIHKRRDICRECPYATRNNQFTESNGLTSLSRCEKCSCFIAAKTKLNKEVCPLGKW